MCMMKCRIVRIVNVQIETRQSNLSNSNNDSKNKNNKNDKKIEASMGIKCNNIFDRFDVHQSLKSQETVNQRTRISEHL